jgi:hypothetical protein
MKKSLINYVGLFKYHFRQNLNTVGVFKVRDSFFKVKVCLRPHFVFSVGYLDSNGTWFFKES